MRCFPLALLVALPLCAQNRWSDQGFTHFYNLEYEQALDCFERGIQERPSSPDLHNHLAQTLLFREMYRDGALESELVTGNNSFIRRPKLNPSPETDRRFFGEINQAMTLTQARIARDAKDTGALYALGISYGLRANYNFLVHKSWREALRNATAARKLHNRVTELDRGNVDARLVQGLHDYLVGSLPLMYRMIGFLAGFHGDRDKGVRTIQDVARNGNLNRVDAEIFLCALYRREGKPKLALPLLDGLLRRFPRNYLLRFEEAQMFAAIGEKQQAIAAVEKVVRLKREGTAGYAGVPWEKIYFQLGTIQFWYNDLDDALQNMRRVTASAEDLDLNTGVLAWMRLGQIYDLTNRRAQALEAYRKAIQYAPQAEAARESKRYLETPYRRG